MGALLTLAGDLLGSLLVWFLIGLVCAFSSVLALSLAIMRVMRGDSLRN